jgi:hypothetical protein
MMDRRNIVMAMLWLAPLAADEPVTRLRVEVRDYKERPVERASVVVTFDEGRSIAKFGKKKITRWELRTNQQGVARLPAIPRGKVRLQVIAKNYQTWGELVELNQEEQVVQVKLNAPQQQYSAHQ